MRNIITTYRVQLIVLLVCVVSILVVGAIRRGLQNAADQKASLLFSQAKTPADFQAILARHPKTYLTFDILMGLGNALVSQGKLSDALGQYEKAYGAYPEGYRGASALCAMGQVRTQIGDQAKAQDNFNQALQMDGYGVKAPQILYEWGRNRLLAGDVAGAKDKFGRLIREWGQTPWARDAATRLASL